MPLNSVEVFRGFRSRQRDAGKTLCSNPRGFISRRIAGLMKVPLPGAVTGSEWTSEEAAHRTVDMLLHHPEKGVQSPSMAFAADEEFHLPLSHRECSLSALWRGTLVDCLLSFG